MVDSLCVLGQLLLVVAPRLLLYQSFFHLMLTLGGVCVGVPPPLIDSAKPDFSSALYFKVSSFFNSPSTRTVAPVLFPNKGMGPFSGVPWPLKARRKSSEGYTFTLTFCPRVWFFFANPGFFRSPHLSRQFVSPQSVFFSCYWI